MTTMSPPRESVRTERSESVIAKLKRLQALEVGSLRLLGGWLPGVARWEAKHEMGLHLWQDAQHSRELRTRLWELRVSNPDRGLDAVVPRLIQGVARAQEDFEFLSGVYLALKPAMLEAYRALARRTHGVNDAPTIAILRRIISEKEAQIAWARESLPELLDTAAKRALSTRWIGHVEELIAAAGGVDGEGSAVELPEPPPGYALRLPFAGARRDERFQLSLAGMPMPEPEDREGNVLFQFFNYAQEMQAAETLASMLWEVEGMEWEFYYDIARHCYDEERHSALGEARLKELGHAVTDFPNCVTNFGWRQFLDPLRRYAVLTYVIEADSFKYKQKTYQEHLRNEDIPSAEAVLYDIMDETLHVRLGQKWVPRLMERYEYKEPLEALVTECREILRANSVSPAQLASANEADGSRKSEAGGRE